MSRCEPEAGEGERCTRDAECKASLDCKDVSLVRRCAAKDCKANGKSCGKNADCCSRNCRDDVIGSGSTCRRL